MKTQRILLSLFVALALVACGEGKWHTHDAFTRPTQAGGTAAVYFLLHNATSTDDALIGGETGVAAAVEIHQSGLVDDMSGMVATGGDDHEHAEGEEHEHAEGEEHEHAEGEEHEGMDAQPMTDAEMQDMANVGGMTHIQRLEIAAGHEVEFEPGGYHLMLVGLTRELVAGETFELTLHFEHGEDLTVQVSVLAP
jgi:copper(I)-binding protein